MTNDDYRPVTITLWVDKRYTGSEVTFIRLLDDVLADGDSEDRIMWGEFALNSTSL